MVASLTRPSLGAEMVDIGVDDLVKLRIVEQLLAIDGEWTSARELCGLLGFHSEERAESELDELASSGAVLLTFDESGAINVRLTPNRTVARRLRALVQEVSRPSASSQVLTFLAKRSLDKARTV